MRLNSSVGRIWLQKTTTSTTPSTACAISARWAGHVRRAIEEHRAELQRDDAQRELLQHRGGDRGVLAAETELRLDALLPGVEILLHFARKNLAELRVDAGHVRGQRLDPRPAESGQSPEAS